MSWIRCRVVCCLLLPCLGLGCRDLGTGQQAAKEQRAYASRKIQQPKPEVRPARQEDLQPGLDAIAEAYRKTQASARNIGPAEEVAVRQIGAAIEASLELSPTLVVWIVDRTPSAQTIRNAAVQAAKSYYSTPEVRQRSLGEGDPLLTAVVAFGEQVEFIVDPPSGDWHNVQAGFDRIQPTTGGREATFAAIQQALEKYVPLRTEDRREVLLVVITDEAGDDPQFVDAIVATTRREAIPVYVIGLPAPWGQAHPFAPNPNAIDPAQAADDSLPTVGPESLFSERVDIRGWTANYATSLEVGLVDSDFGPFALEKLCRASRGQFFAIRPAAGSEAYRYRGTTYQYWPPGNELRFDEGVASKYAPDYVSEADYQGLLAENKARQALHQAAKLPPLRIDGYPESRFPKGTEAQMARRLSQAQQFAAKHAPSVDQLYAVLSAGEADRDTLTGPRWQAQYDLAMGQLLALKVRLDGYNSMIAALKRGRSFQNEGSTTWVLEPADAFETESTIRKLAERGAVYLDRVIAEHPGTPWAKIAAEERRAPLGWTWKEE